MFITKEEFGTMEGLNNALERVYHKAIEETLKVLPEVILGLIVKTKAIQKSYAEFKDKHPEYSGREKELAEVIQSLEFEHGALNLDQLLEKVPGKMKDISIEIPKDQATSTADVERISNGFI